MGVLILILSCSLLRCATLRLLYVESGLLDGLRLLDYASVPTHKRCGVEASRPSSGSSYG